MTHEPPPKASAPHTAVGGKTFDEFAPGSTWRTLSRTLTEADIGAFAGLSGDFNPLHVDAEHAARTPFRTRIAHGLLVQAIASGLAWQAGWFAGTIVALREVSMTFLAAAVPGDTLTLELEVVEREPDPGPRRGWVRFATRVRNQRDEIVLDGVWLALVTRRRVQRNGSAR